jgi:hypothetical protein
MEGVSIFVESDMIARDYLCRDERIDERIDESIDEGIDERIDERMSERDTPKVSIIRIFRRKTA